MLPIVGLPVMLISFAVHLPPIEGHGDEMPFSRVAMGKSADRVFGHMRGSYILPNELIVDQTFEGLGQPDRSERLRDGNYRVSGCRQHSCDEKAAVIASPKGEVLAVGLISPPAGCAFSRRAPDDCIRKTRLTIFVKAANDRPVLLKPLYDWARSFPGGSSKQKVSIFEKVIVPRQDRAKPRKN